MILMLIGVVYLFKLLLLNKNAGLRLGLDEEKLVAWSDNRRKQYIWMVAAGWGTFVLQFAAGMVVTLLTNAGQLKQEDTIGTQIIILLIGVMVMIWCWNVSSSYAKKANAVSRDITVNKGESKTNKPSPFILLFATTIIVIFLSLFTGWIVMIEHDINMSISIRVCLAILYIFIVAFTFSKIIKKWKTR